MKLKVIATAVAISLAGVGAASAASLLSGIFDVRAVHVTNLNRTLSGATLENFNNARTEASFGGTNSVKTIFDFVYTGTLNFSVETTGDGAQRIDNWLNTGTGASFDLPDTIDELQLSKSSIDGPDGGTATTTFFEFTLRGPLTEGLVNVRHDDGIAVLRNGDVVGGFPGPNTVRNTNGIEFAGGRFGLLYVATNGNPSILQVTTTAQQIAPVPVPAALPMLLAAMGGLGWMARRRRAAA